MDANQNFIINQHIAKLNDTLLKFSDRAEEKLTNITEELNRCQTNLTILEKKIENSTKDKNIVLASLFYACYANSEQIGLGLANVDTSIQGSHSAGIKTLEADNFRLDCFETLTKVKFVVISDLKSRQVDKQDLLRRIYDLYADYVIKNPFYTLNMPVNSDNCSLFKANLDKYLYQT